jgi:actin-like ATPase involved in cell morphogenesis
MAHTHIEQGDYRGKHRKDAPIDERIAEAIRNRAEEKRITCKRATRISEELGVTVEEVGRTADLLEIKVEQCQLGLFGYTRTKRKKSIMKPAEAVSKELETAIRGALVQGKLPCAAAWKIADEQGISKMSVCAAADALKIKITDCQLGAF